MVGRPLSKGGTWVSHFLGSGTPLCLAGASRDFSVSRQTPYLALVNALVLEGKVVSASVGDEGDWMAGKLPDGGGLC